jgi:hypothetical protein
MKKFLSFLMVMCMTLLMMSCNGCGQPQDNLNADSTKVDTVQVDSICGVATIDVDHAIATDRQAMFVKFGKDYRWYETEILLPYFLDSDSVMSDPVMLVNIFQSIAEKDNGADTYVWKFQHFPDGTVLTDSIHGFWIENWPLNDDVIKLNYLQAWDQMMAVNFPKPHSKHVTLRNPVGPVAVNAQWIFGNIKEQIWIDAVTGEAKKSNPAFPEEKGFKMPLGEWP